MVPVGDALRVSSDDTGGTDDEAGRATASRLAEARQTVAQQVPGMVTLVVDHSQAMCRALVLPTTDPTELMGMAMLQLENQLPFVADEMAVAVEVLSVDEVNTTVLACAVPIATLDGFADRLGLARERVRRLDVSGLALSRLLQRHGCLTAERDVVLFAEGDVQSLMVMDAGLPLIIRTVNGSSDEIMRQIRLSLVQMEAEHGSRIVRRVLCIGEVTMSPTPSSEGGTPLSDIAERLKAELGCEVRRLAEEDVGMIVHGGALRSAEESAFDVQPPSWKERKASASFRKGLWRVLGIGVAVWAIGALYLYGMPWLLERRIATETEGLKFLAPSVRAVNNVRTRVLLINAYMDRRLSALDTLHEVVQALPPAGMEFSEYRYRREERESRITIRGIADNTQLVYDFNNQIDRSPLFERSVLSGVTTERGSRRVTFELAIHLKEDK